MYNASALISVLSPVPRAAFLTLVPGKYQGVRRIGARWEAGKPVWIKQRRKHWTGPNAEAPEDTSPQLTVLPARHRVGDVQTAWEMVTHAKCSDD